MDPILQDLKNNVMLMYNPYTTTESKMNCQQHIVQFMSRSDSCVLALKYFKESTDLYFRIFCVSVIQKSIDMRWSFFSAEMRTYIKSEVVGFIFNKNLLQQDPSSVSFCRLLVLIARNDLPEEFQDVFSIIENALNDNVLEYWGVMMLLNLLEEVMCENYQMLSKKRKFLLAMFAEKYKRFIDILISKMLDICYGCYNMSAPQFSNFFSSFQASLNPPMPARENSSFSYYFANYIPSSSFSIDNNRSKVGVLMLEIFFKYIQLFPEKSALSENIIKVLVVIAWLPLEIKQIQQPLIELTQSALKIINEIISHSTFLMHHSEAVSDLMHTWSFGYLNAFANVDSNFEEFHNYMINFFNLFAPIYIRKIFIKTSDASYHERFLIFASGCKSFHNFAICLSTISELVSGLLSFAEKHQVYKSEKFLLCFAKFTDFAINLITNSSSDMIDSADDVVKECVLQIDKLIVDVSPHVSVDISQFFMSDFNALLTILLQIIATKPCPEGTNSLNSIEVIPELFKNQLARALSIGTRRCYFQNTLMKLSINFNDIKCLETFYETTEMLIKITDTVSSHFNTNKTHDTTRTKMYKFFKQCLRTIITCISVIAYILYPLINLPSSLGPPFNDQMFNDRLIERSSKILGKIIEIIFWSIDKQESKKTSKIIVNVFCNIVTKIPPVVCFRCFDFMNFFSSLVNLNILTNEKKTLFSIQMLVVFVTLKKYSEYNNIANNQITSLIQNVLDQFVCNYDVFSKKVMISINEQKIDEFNKEIKNFASMTEFITELMDQVQVANPESRRFLYLFFSKLSEELDRFCRVLIQFSNDPFPDYFYVFKKVTVFKLKFISTFNYSSLTYVDGIFQLLVSVSKNSNSQNTSFQYNCTEIFLDVISSLNEVKIHQSKFQNLMTFIIDSIYSRIKFYNFTSLMSDLCNILTRFFSLKLKNFMGNSNKEYLEAFYNLFLLLLEEMNEEDIDSFKELIQKIIVLNEKYPIATNPLLSNQTILFKLLYKSFSFLLSPSFSSIHEDILNFFFSVASKDIQSFNGKVLPVLMSQVQSLDDQQKSFLLASIVSFDDSPSFCEQLKNLVHDMLYLSNISKSESLLTF